MAENKKNSELDRSSINLHKFDVRYDTGKQAINATKWVAIAYFANQAIQSIAGKVTLADVNFKAIINQEATGLPFGYILLIVFLALLVGFLGILYGRYESKLRRDTVERLTFQITQLQKMIDPIRTSSMLTTRGETAEKDKR